MPGRVVDPRQFPPPSLERRIPRLLRAGLAATPGGVGPSPVAVARPAEEAAFHIPPAGAAPRGGAPATQAYSSTTTLRAETPPFCTSSAAGIASSPCPAIIGSGAGT